MRVAVCGPIDLAGLSALLERNPNQPLPSGQLGTAVTQLITGLVDQGFEVVAVTLDQKVSEPMKFTGPHLSLRVGPYRERHRARDLFRSERRFIRAALVEEQPDLAHAHWTYEYALGALSSGIPTLVTIRDWAPTVLRYDTSPYRAVRLLMNLETLERAPALTVTSPYMQDLLRQWSRRHAPVIPNGLRDDYFQRRRKLQDLVAPELVSVNAGFGARKNVGRLLQAFRIVRQGIPNSRLRLVGPGYERGGAAHRWAVQHGLSNGVIFSGKKPFNQVLGVLRNADLLVHPSREESFGNTLVEAMAQGLPVVAGEASGAPPWVLEYGAAGVLTDVSSASRLALAILSVLDDPECWQALSNAAYKRASDSFRLSSSVTRYAQAYQRVSEVFDCRTQSHSGRV